VEPLPVELPPLLFRAWTSFVESRIIETAEYETALRSLHYAQFIRQNQFGSFLPELALTIKNQTSSPWRTLKLEFDIGGLCNGETRQ
jgi:hypothetical protein